MIWRKAILEASQPENAGVKAIKERHFSFRPRPSRVRMGSKRLSNEMALSILNLDRSPLVFFAALRGDPQNFVDVGLYLTLGRLVQPVLP